MGITRGHWGMPSPRRPRRRRRTVGLMVAIPLAVGALAVASVSAGIRLAPDDPTKWHQDPLTVQAPETPNWYRLLPADVSGETVPERDAAAPVFDVPTSSLESAFDEVAMGDGRVKVVEGSAAQGFVTYVQRSALMGYPDYVSVRFIEVDDATSTVALLSRSRYGSGDLGVNEKRVKRWIDATQARLEE